MRRALPLLLLLVTSLTACSYSTYFVVINESDVPVEVSYTLKERRGMKDYGLTPAEKWIEEVDNFDIPWREMEKHQYRYDEVAGTIVVALPPGKALSVERVSNYSTHDRENDDSFDIESIRVTGPHGSIQYSGREARTQFDERRRQVFAITYR